MTCSYSRPVYYLVYTDGRLNVRVCFVHTYSIIDYAPVHKVARDATGTQSHSVATTQRVTQYTELVNKQSLNNKTESLNKQNHSVHKVSRHTEFFGTQKADLSSIHTESLRRYSGTHLGLSNQLHRWCIYTYRDFYFTRCGLGVRCRLQFLSLMQTVAS